MRGKGLLSFVACLSILLGPFEKAGAETPQNRLQNQINSILEKSGLEESRVSMEVVSLPQGRILYQRQPNLSLNPASCLKLVTAGAALHTLGPNFTFKTEFYSDTLLKDGRVENIWIKGYGDPMLVTEELDTVIQRFRAAGLREINGGIFVDDTYFDRYPLTTYLSEVGQKTYNIVTGPLSFNFNKVPKATRPRQKVRKKVHSDRFSHKARRAVEGATPAPINDPAIYTGSVILQAFEDSGVVVRGGLQREAVPQNALLILTHSSPSLSEILKGLGKFSNNFIAEQLLKTLGAVRLGPPGSAAKGKAVLGGYLQSLGVPQGTYTIDNGSGLSKLTQLSSDHLIRVLLDLYRSPWREDVISTLSIAGIDGTLRRRFRRSSLRGQVFAKTGTLNGVRSLSGYVFDDDHKQGLAFSFLFNDFRVSLERVNRAEEQILETVAATLR